MFVIKFILRYKPYFLKLLDLLPKNIQTLLKSKYRKYIAKNLYRFDDSTNLEISRFAGDSYELSSTINRDYKSGVNLVGLPTAKFGLGEHLRSVGSVFELSKSNHQYYDCQKYFLGNYGDDSVSDKIQESLNYNTNIFVCNGDAIGFIYNDHGNDFFKGRYNIHYGAWELRDYPKEWIPTLNIFQEYWAMSSFLQKSVSDVAKIPVVHMPYPVDFKIPTSFIRSDFRIPEDKFTFIFTFDISSVTERKNPRAVIKAFKLAFPKNNDVTLVVKVSSKKDFVTHQEEVKSVISDIKNDSRIVVIDEVLSRDKILGLINCCDVYVSLHRAEGFGIGMAEAMKMGKAVIATNYSGNTDFTLSHNSCLVDYKLIPLKPLEYIYEEGKVWADADIEHAAYYMKKLFEDSDYYVKISKAGKEYIDENYSVKAIMPKYISRLKILGLLK
jgi:glycosyltransferase involved in cell wall biosynthesis